METPLPKNIETDYSFEQVKATWLNETFIIPQLENLYRIDAKNGRFYVKYDNGAKYFPSVTTIIDKTAPTPIGLQKWRSDLGWDESKKIADIAAHYGTFMHIIWGELLLKKDIDLNEHELMNKLNIYYAQQNIVEESLHLPLFEWIPKIKQDTIGFICFVKDYDIEPIAIEISMTSKKGFAGSIDLICMARLKKDKEKERIMVDFKSGRHDFYLSNILQLTGYKLMWNENFPDYKVSRIFNYGCKNYRYPIGKTPPYNFKEHKEDLTVQWNKYLDLYKMDEENLKPKLSTKIKECVVNINTNIEEVFKVYDPDKLYEDYHERTNSKGTDSNENSNDR